VSPNPFSQGTVISFSAPTAIRVAIDIYNVHGQLVRTVFSGAADAGQHEVAWDGTDSRGARVARGVYFCRMNAGPFSATEKLVVLQ
jgi:flagellar hook assembly protein FlgD